MAKNLVFKLTCDLCKDSWTVDEAEFKRTAKSYPVKFLTEQNEGRGVKPYFEFALLDLCADCEENLLKVYPLTAVGAMGYNEYKIKEQADGE